MLIVLVFAGSRSTAMQAVVGRNIFYAPAVQGTLQPYLEVYWQIDPRSVAWRKSDDGWNASLITSIIITTDTGVVYRDVFRSRLPPVENPSEISSQKVVDLRRFLLSDGHFDVRILFSDSVRPDNQFVYNDSFTIQTVKTPFFSDIQLVDTTVFSAEQSVFQRNDKTQIPLCANFFDEHRKQLRYYFEVYFTNHSDTSGAPLVQQVFISRKPLETPLNYLQHQDTLLPALLQFKEGAFSLATLPSGNYYLNSVLRQGAQTVANRSLFFQLLNEHPKEFSDTGAARKTEETENLPSFLNLNKTFLGKYSPAQIRAILKMITPVATPTERLTINGFLKNPDDTYSRYFIYNFWLNRNKLKPEQAWNEYAARVKEANKLFGSSLLHGYESDRGKTYLKFGKPDERIRVENEAGALPYEVWQYQNLEGAVNGVFLFYRAGYASNDYRLLHSTVPNEVNNKRWRETLYPNGRGEEGAESRAEQYLGNR